MSADKSEKQFCMNCGREMRYSWEAKKWICDDCQLSREAPAPPPPAPKPKESMTLSAIASALAIFGIAVIGGVYLEIPAIIIAGVAIYRRERGAWASLAIGVICLGATLVLLIINL